MQSLEYKSAAHFFLVVSASLLTALLEDCHKVAPIVVVDKSHLGVLRGEAHCPTLRLVLHDKARELGFYLIGILRLAICLCQSLDFSLLPYDALE